MVKLLERQKEDLEFTWKVRNSESNEEFKREECELAEFMITMEQFFYLFQAAQKEIMLEKTKMKGQQPSLLGCADCVSCTTRYRDESLQY